MVLRKGGWIGLMLESVEEVKKAVLEAIGETAEQTDEVTRSTAENLMSV